MSEPAPPSGTRPSSLSAAQLDALTSYMKLKVEGFPADVTRVRAWEFIHGQSNPTHLVVANERSYVVRTKPAGKILPSAHLIEREYRIMNALKGSRVPVPMTFCLCDDPSVIGVAFFVMAFVQGRIFKDPLLRDQKPQDRFAIYSAMITTLAAIHSVDLASRGLLDYGKSDRYVERQVERWSKQYELAKTGDVPDFDRMAEYLRSSTPKGDDSQAVTLVHGDFRLDNLIFHPTQNRVVAVLDWELSTLGHPTSDVAYCGISHFLPAGSPGMPGLLGVGPLGGTGIPTLREVVQSYERITQRARPVSDFRFYLVLSFFRLASISQGVYKRSLQGNASGGESASRYDQVTRLMSGIGARLSVATDAEMWAGGAGRGAKAGQPAEDPRDGPAALELKPFGFSSRFYELRRRLLDFMDEHVYPNEGLYHAQHDQLAAANGGNRFLVPPVIEDLKKKAREAGLWNLFLTKNRHHSFGPGLTNLEYAPLCEIMGRSLHMAPEAFNCAAPDTGNMEVLAMYGTPEQQRRWLEPLMRGEIRSCFGMTEPMVASSDATNIECRIDRHGDEYVINGRKWWTSGAMDPRCTVCILMGRTSTTGPAHKQQSMVIVPMDTPGVRIERYLTVFGYDDAPHGHAEVEFRNVRVPVSNILLGEGRGFEIAQGRLGPGRIHHVMRSIGMAERALEAMVRRVQTRYAFGSSGGEYAVIQQAIADSRIEITQVRMMTLLAASMIDASDTKDAKQYIAAIKVAAPATCLRVIDRAIQAHGGMGVCQDTVLASLWAQARTLRIVDGPDDVHRGTIAKLELQRAKF